MRVNLLRVVFIVLATGLFSAMFLISSPDAAAQQSARLYVLNGTPEAKPDNEKNSPASIRESDITVEFDRLRGSMSIGIPLFDGKTYVAWRSESEGFETRGENSFLWRGTIVEENSKGDVVLTVNKGILNGLIFSPAGVYEIVAKGDRQILIELDQSLFPECLGEVKPPAGKPDGRQTNLGIVEDSGDRIDVLVVYTEAVKNSLGGDAQAQTLAQNAVDATNTAYINSKIRQRLRLVHTEQTALTEANTLSNLRADAATQALRDTHNADMVAMLVDTLGGCGIAYVMTNVSTGFAPSAYSITRRSCAVGNLTFAHELGHNMGSTHDPANGGSAAFPYSYGHFVNGNYRTVMSYSNQCTSGCGRVPQFSNPAIIFNGVQTGILGSRENARSIENTADTVSNFRYSGSFLRLENYSENGFIPRNISRSLNWSADNVIGNVKIELSRDEGTTWETLIADTPNDGSEIINVAGRPTRRVRLRISSISDFSTRDSSVRNLSIK